MLSNVRMAFSLSTRMVTADGESPLPASNNGDSLGQVRQIFVGPQDSVQENQSVDGSGETQERVIPEGCVSYALLRSSE